MGRVQQFAREGKQLPPGCAVDADGKETTDPNKVKSLMTFGAHKGYGLSLIDELYAAYIGGSLPTIRNRWDRIPAGEKGTCCFYFQCIHPEAMSANSFAMGRTQSENVKAVLSDILGHGNDKCLLPGEIEARGAALSQKHGGLLFTPAEIQALTEIAQECQFPMNSADLKAIEIG